MSIINRKKSVSDNKKTDLSIFLFGINFTSKDKSQLLNELSVKLSNSLEMSNVLTPNPEFIVLAKKNPELEKMVKRANRRGDCFIPDGVGLLIVSRIIGFFDKSKKLKEKITGVDFAVDLVKESLKQKKKILILGGRGYEELSFKIKSGRQNVKCKIVNLNNSSKSSIENNSEKEALIFWSKGYADVRNPSREEEKRIEKNISKLKPDILFVAFGAPHQEYWLDQNQDLLKNNNVRIAMVVGGTFDYLLGIVKRAPVWIQKLGFEWLVRLIRQPWRWRRQLRLITFIWIALIELITTLRDRFVIWRKK